MSRAKITEYRAKKLLLPWLGMPFVAVDGSGINSLDRQQSYVLKVDQGVKGRMKKGLVKLQVAAPDISAILAKWRRAGYTNSIIELFLPHSPTAEKFISLERRREGTVIYYSNHGGVDIESQTDALQQAILTAPTISQIARFLQIPSAMLQKLQSFIDQYYISFLEINPLVSDGNRLHILDLAVEVDTAGEFFVKDAWTKKDIVDGSLRQKEPEEKNIEQLAQNSQAAFNFTVVNPDGAVFMLLSGGGASIVLADEVYNLGYGKQLANYGEYSGNPNTEETYYYTKNVLQFLLRSQAPRKVLIIGGGVANFTDIRATFKGVVSALKELALELKEQKVKVFVRRGGPYQAAGLANMKHALEELGLYGLVIGPEMMLTDIVKLALGQII